MTRQHIARLGDLQLESGGVLQDCRIGYRIKGQLDASKANAVLVIPWFQGRSGDLLRYVGQGKLVDPLKYAAILVDPLGNGVSSSPSNSRQQSGARFPSISIRDIVASQHRLVTDILGLRHLIGVIGLSMGGMMVFQWVTSYPGLMDKGVSIVGSPQAQPDDRRRWEARVAQLTTESAWRRAKTAIFRLRPRTAINEWRIHSHDHIRQGLAIMRNDISAPFGGSMARAVAEIRAELLVAGTRQDEEVNPTPAFDVARMARAEVLELDGRCGHYAPNCEAETLWPAIGRFLSRRDRIDSREASVRRT